MHYMFYYKIKEFEKQNPQVSVKPSERCLGSFPGPGRPYDIKAQIRVSYEAS